MDLELIRRESTLGPMREMTDADPALAAASRDLERVARDEYSRLRGLAWRFGLPEEELDDAVQDAFCKALAGLHRFRGESSLSTWVTRIAINQFTSRRARWLRRVQVFSSNHTLQHDAPQPPACAETSEAFARAVACVRKLPVKLRRVCVLRYLEGYNVAEAASLLDIPEATVKSRSYSACQKLRHMMRGFER